MFVFHPFANYHQLLRDFKEDLIPEDHISQADAWAVERCAELCAKGVPARVRRFRDGEPSCVIYPLQALENAREAVA